MVTGPDSLADYEAEAVSSGYEGVMVRKAGSPYKCGRSSAKEGYLGKIKRFEDGEAEIVGFYEMEHNQNVEEKDAFGRTKRSTKAEGMVPAGVLGGFDARDYGGFGGEQFNGLNVNAMQSPQAQTAQTAQTPNDPLAGFRGSAFYQLPRDPRIERQVSTGAGARGMLFDGSTLNAMREAVSNDDYGRLLDFNNTLGTGSAQGAGIAQGLGSLGANMAANNANQRTNAAQAQATSYGQQANAFGSALGSIAGGFSSWMGNRKAGK
jgi:hypothetical protein